jgi:hypothetical protein
MADGRDEGFLNRWARRKQRTARQSAAKPGPRPTSSDTPAAPSEAERAAAEARQQELIDSLPDPDQLGPDGDYTQFLQDGVPAELRQRALRRLWTSNPVFANLDGLNDYDLDYTDAATVVENLKTAFQAGRGMVTREEREAEAAADRPAEDAPAEDAPAAEAPMSVHGAGATAGESQDAGATGDLAGDVPVPGADPGGIGRTAGARDRPTPDGRVRVKGTAARRRWGG